MTMHVNISSVWKNILSAHVNVGGVWKGIREGYVNVGGVWKLFWQSVYTLAAEFHDDAVNIYVGLNNVIPIGGLDPTTLNGLTIRGLFDLYESGTETPIGLFLEITAGADPGASFFTTMQITGLTAALTSASATYNYAAGRAQWKWTPVAGFIASNDYEVIFT